MFIVGAPWIWNEWFTFEISREKHLSGRISKSMEEHLESISNTAQYRGTWFHQPPSHWCPPNTLNGLSQTLMNPKAGIYVPSQNTYLMAMRHSSTPTEPLKRSTCTLLPKWSLERKSSKPLLPPSATPPVYPMKKMRVLSEEVLFKRSQSQRLCRWPVYLFHLTRIPPICPSPDREENLQTWWLG